MALSSTTAVLARCTWRNCGLSRSVATAVATLDGLGPGQSCKCRLQNSNASSPICARPFIIAERLGVNCASGTCPIGASLILQCCNALHVHTPAFSNAASASLTRSLPDMSWGRRTSRVAVRVRLSSVRDFTSGNVDTAASPNLASSLSLGLPVV